MRRRQDAGRSHRRRARQPALPGKRFLFTLTQRSHTDVRQNSSARRFLLRCLVIFCKPFRTEQKQTKETNGGRDAANFHGSRGGRSGSAEPRYSKGDQARQARSFRVAHAPVPPQVIEQLAGRFDVYFRTPSECGRLRPKRGPVRDCRRDR
jgi:hypothetical protein